MSRLKRWNGRARVCVCVTGNVYPIDSMRCDGCSVVGASRNPRNSSISFHFASPRLVSSKCPRILCLVTEHVPHSLAAFCLHAFFPLCPPVFPHHRPFLFVFIRAAHNMIRCVLFRALGPLTELPTLVNAMYVCVCKHQLRHTQTNSTHRGNQARRIFRASFLASLCVRFSHSAFCNEGEGLETVSYTGHLLQF